MYQTMSEELDRLFEVQMAKRDRYEEPAILPRLADRKTHGVPFPADRAVGRSAVDGALAEVVGQRRSDDLPDCLERLSLKQLVELRGGLEAEAERLEELIEQLDYEVGGRDEEIASELAELAALA